MMSRETYRLVESEGHFDFCLCDSSDINYIYTRVPAEPLPYNSDCFIITNEEKKRIIDLSKPYIDHFPYSTVVPFSKEQNGDFLHILLNYSTEVQGYWHMDSIGGCVGLTVFIKGCPHFKYEISLEHVTDRPVSSISPLKRVETNYEEILDFWKIIYSDGQHDILLQTNGQLILLNGNLFM